MTWLVVLNGAISPASEPEAVERYVGAFTTDLESRVKFDVEVRDGSRDRAIFNPGPVTLPCSNGLGGRSNYEPNNFRFKSARTFEDTHPRNPDLEGPGASVLKVRGRVMPDGSAKGFFRRYTASSTATCDTGRLRWEAERVDEGGGP